MLPAPPGMLVIVPSDWLQGRTAFGGMQAAIAVRAMREALPADVRSLPLRAAQTTFIGPVPGRVEIHAQAVVLRVGRSTCHSRCDLLHEGKVVCSVMACSARHAHQCSSRNYRARIPESARRIACPRSAAKPLRLSCSTSSNAGLTALRHSQGPPSPAR